MFVNDWLSAFISAYAHQASRAQGLQGRGDVFYWFCARPDHTGEPWYFGGVFWLLIAVCGVFSQNLKAKVETAWEQCLQSLFMTKTPQASIRLSQSAEALGSCLSLKCGHGPSPRLGKGAPLQVRERASLPRAGSPGSEPPGSREGRLSGLDASFLPGEVVEVTAFRRRPAEAEFPKSQPKNIILK